MEFMIFMVAFSALAIGNSVFFGIYLLRSHNDVLSNRLLAFLLFALALRITKSVIAIAFPGASDIYAAIGVTGMAAIGPLTFLYIKSLFGWTFRPSTALIHFIPALVIALTMAFVSDQTIYLYYQLVATQLLIYLFVSIGQVIMISRDLPMKKTKKDWSVQFLVGVGIIGLGFLYQLIADSFASYIVATAIAALVLYILSFQAMRQKRVLKAIRKNGLDGQLQTIAEEVKDLFVNQKWYREEDVTLNRVGKYINRQPYLVSRAINEVYHMTFPEYLNSFRIEEVKKKIVRDINHAMSIEALAYDSGFSTLSSFYSSFKKQVKMTPSQFREQYSGKTEVSLGSSIPE